MKYYYMHIINEEKKIHNKIDINHEYQHYSILWNI